MKHTTLNDSQKTSESSQPIVFSLGYEKRTLEEYLSILQMNNVKAVVDVRRNPISRKRGFSKRALRTAVETMGIKYYHVPELGISSDQRRRLNTKEDYEALFSLYLTELLPNNHKSIETISEILENQKRIVLTCFERDHTYCHRNPLITYAEEKGFIKTSVYHLDE